MNRILTSDRLAALVGTFDRAPAYRGLRRALQELIGDGRIALGTRLPSERAVAQRLDIARNTVTRAYADLVAAGFATVRQGAGTYASVPSERRRAHEHALHAIGNVPLSDGNIDLNCAASGATPGVAAAYERALAALPAHLSSDGYLPAGLPALQARIAESYSRRGLPTTPEQVIVTSGALAAIAVVARALSRPGDRVMIESPVYSNAIEAVRLGGGRLVSAPLGDALGNEGWDLDGIEATLRQTSPHLAYLIPDFQNPTGFLMPDAARERYAAALRATRTVAIVDEALQATCLDDDLAMPAPFAAYATDAITIGSVSKLFWGGLRVGWIRAPRDLIERMIAARVQLDLGTSLFDQLVVAELMDDTAVADLRRTQLRQRRDALAQTIRDRLPDWRFRLPQGGLSLWLQLPHGSATRLAADAEVTGVHLAPGPVFSVEGGMDQWLRIPYAKPEEQLVQAVERIAAAAPASPPEHLRRRRAVHPLIA
jgi:DNA-binding transcriptional MocR family regulator